MSISNKKRNITLGILVTVLISGGVAAGLFLTLGKRNVEIIGDQPTPQTTNKNSQQIIPETTSNVESASVILDSGRYDINCNYSDRYVDNGNSVKVWEYYEKETLENDDNRVCVFKVDDKVTNNLPIFVFEANVNPEITFTSEFHNNIQPLTKTEFEEYREDGISLSGFAPRYRKYTDISTLNTVEYNTKYQDKVKENTMKITKYLIDQLSFGSELNLLDVVTLSTVKKFVGGVSKGLFSNNLGIKHSVNYLENDDGTLTPNGNRKKIDLTIESSQYVYEEGENRELLRHVGEKPLYDTQDYSGITFDLFSVGQTISHEYGHLVTLHNQKLNKNTFLELLKKPFETGATTIAGRDEEAKREDFEKIYKYFNNIGADRYIDLKPAEGLRDIDLEILSLYRNYFSKNATMLSTKLLSLTKTQPGVIVPTSLVDEDAVLNILDSIIKENDQNVNGKLSTTLIQKIKDTKKEVTSVRSSKKTIDIPKYDELLAYLETESNDIPIYVIPDYFALYSKNIKLKEFIKILPKSFSKTILEKETQTIIDRAVTVKNILPSQVPINTATVAEGRVEVPSQAYCGELPFNDLSMNIFNYEFKLLKAESVKTNLNPDTYEDLSKKHDLKFMETLAYLFSFEELSARLFGVLTFSYDDHRNTLNTCKAKFIQKPAGTEGAGYYFFQPVSNGESYETVNDYGRFKAFGFDVLNGNNEKTILKDLISEKGDLDTNTIQFKTQNSARKQNTELFYSANEIGQPFLKSTDTTPEKEIIGWPTIYKLARVKLTNKEDAYKTTIMFKYTDLNGNEQVIYRRANPINYNQKTYQDRTSILGSNTENYLDDENEVELSFDLETISGILHNNPDRKTISFSKNEFRNFEEVDKVYGTNYKVFVDENGNNIFDEGEQELTIK